MMSRNAKIALILALAVLVTGLLYLLNAKQRGGDISISRIQVVSSFYPLSYLVEKIGGDFVAVTTIVPSGVEPHDFEPSPRNFVDIGNANLFLYNGGGLESWAKKWNESATMRPGIVIDMAQALKNEGAGLREQDGAVDPHFWLDPVILKKEAMLVRDALSQADPAHKDLFLENSKQVIAELEELDRLYRAGLASCSIHDIIVLHEAFNYLGYQYGIGVISIEGISPDEEPSPKDLARIVNTAKEKNISHIFFETIASPKFSELIAREIRGNTLVLNPLESLTPEEVQRGEDYVTIMKANLKNLQIALSCQN